MHVIGETTTDGVAERVFELEVAGDRVPGVLWCPADASGGRPLLLMGHGGSQHKKVQTLVARARRYVTAHGFAVLAIDAPDHGDRVTTARTAEFAAAVQRRIAEGQRDGGEAAQDLIDRVAKAVPEWRAALDAVQALDVVGDDGPVGYWGISMGTGLGVPLVAAEPRITAAVFGLAGVLPGVPLLVEAARRITIPIEFVLQSDDELISREAGIALFDAFASPEKTLHLNPGGHLGIPAFERTSWELFFARHLVRAA
jgi:poly(3-hydroxybutyrate) depolymerase